MAVLKTQHLYNKPFKLLARKLFHPGRLVKTDRATDAAISLKGFSFLSSLFILSACKIYEAHHDTKVISEGRASCFCLIESMQI